MKYAKRLSRLAKISLWGLLFIFLVPAAIPFTGLAIDFTIYNSDNLQVSIGQSVDCYIRIRGGTRSDRGKFVFGNSDVRFLGVEFRKPKSGPAFGCDVAVEDSWVYALLLVIALILGRNVAWQRNMQKRRDMICPSCGYDCRATRERCPECGTELDKVIN